MFRLNGKSMPCSSRKVISLKIGAHLNIIFNRYAPSKTKTSIRQKELHRVKENENNLVTRKDIKRTAFRNTK